MPKTGDIAGGRKRGEKGEGKGKIERRKKSRARITVGDYSMYSEVRNKD